MTVIRRPSPFTFRHAVDRLFDESAFRPIARGYAVPQGLPLDISSTDDAITVEAALPGVRPEDVELTVHENALTITVKESEQAEETEGERVYREVRRSHGSRTLRLPSGLDIDSATATFENGMLRLAIPRAEEAKPRQIPLSTVNGATAAVVATDTEASAEDAAKA